MSEAVTKANQQHERMNATCINGRIAPSPTTKLRLFADSAGYCQNPNCRLELFKAIEDDTIHVAEIAHVIAAEKRGPRSSDEVTAEERASYENLILLCPTCHTMIDKAPNHFPAAIIFEWKANHRERISTLFGCQRLTTRQEVRSVLVPILSANRTIFEQYGPMTDERYNPESSLATFWGRKVRASIIPNNRLILMLCDANRHLLNPQEVCALDLFRQHNDDLEARHIIGMNIAGIQFPPDVNNLFQ